MLTDHVVHLGKKYSAMLIAISLLSSSFGFNVPIVSAEETDKDDLLQFTSQNHILGFRSDGIYVASTQHALKTSFLRANNVTPVSDTNAGPDASGTVPALSKVTYENIWNGITAVYEAEKDSLMKSTYYVDITKKGVTANSILLQYNRPVNIDANGDLQIAFEDGILTEKAPIAWQETETGRHPVAVSFKLYRKNVVGFSLGEYLPNIPIVVDPSLTWNTFVGASGNDFVQAMTIDTSGNVYVAGDSTVTWGSPVRAYTSGQDGFAAKLDSSGTLVWNTFLGGSGSDRLYGIKIDASGNLYIAGWSSATWGSPIRAYTSGNDGAVTKLDNNGTLTWNTFLGGSGSDESIRGIMVDTSSNVYLGGWSNATWGSPVRAYTLGTDGFAVKLDTNGGLTWNTFLGGSGSDFTYSITADTSGNVYAGGYSTATWGSPVRTYTSGNDGFAAKLDSSGTLTWNTFLGGSGTDDEIKAITINSSGSIFVGGYSDATWGSPIRAYTSGYDGVVTKLDSNGTLTWNTFLGGSGSDSFYAITLDTSDNVYIAGTSNATWGSPVRAYSSSNDGFAVKLDTNGALTWNTFLGGSGTDESIRGVIVDTNSNVYLGGYSNATWGSPLNAYVSGYDGLVAKINDDTAAPTVSTLSPADNATDVSTTANLVLTFNETIGKAGTGTVTIKKASDNSTVETISVTGSLVTGSGTTTMTINPSVTLDYATEYYVQINAMAFPDASGNFYAGISSTTSWSFTTEAAPAVAVETTDTPVVIPRGGGRGSSSPGRGGKAPLIDFTTMQVISTNDSSYAGTPPTSSPEQASNPPQQSSPAVLLLLNQRTKLLERIEKKIVAALTDAARKMLESNRERLIKRINAKIESLLMPSK